MVTDPTAISMDDSDVDRDLADFERRNDWSWSALTERWTADRGTLLIGVAVVVAIVGSIIIAIQQNRFRPVAFPDGSAIQRAEVADDSSNAIPGASVAAAAGPLSDLPSVVFELHGVQIQRGPVLVAFYDQADAFDANDLASAFAKLQVSSDQDVARFRLPSSSLPDRFALAAYQDHDGNGTLSRGALGIPSEPYGFSRDARATLGRPAYDAAVIDRPASDSQPVAFTLQ